MSEIFKEFLVDLTLAVISVLAIYACRAADQITEKAAAEIENENARHYAEEIGRAVSEAVSCTCQTYVDSLKESKSFTKEAQAEAMSRSLNTAIQLLSPAALDFIKEVYGDTTEYLMPKIEASVREQRKIYVY